MKLFETINRGYLAYVLDESSRQKLLKAFPPKFPNVYAHHATVEYGIVKTKDELLGSVKKLFVVGYISDESLETVIVSVDGFTDRPDGQIFHITLSLDKSKGRKPADSNSLIKMMGYSRIKQPIELNSVLQFLR